MKNQIQAFLRSMFSTFALIGLLTTLACARAPIPSVAPYVDTDQSSKLVPEDDMAAKGCKFDFGKVEELACEPKEDRHARYEQIAAVSRYAVKAEAALHSISMDESTRANLGIKHVTANLYLSSNRQEELLKYRNISFRPRTFENLHDGFYFYLRQLAGVPRVVVEFDAIPQLPTKSVEVSSVEGKTVGTPATEAMRVKVKVMNGKGLAYGGNLLERLKKLIADYKTVQTPSEEPEVARMAEVAERIEAGLAQWLEE